MLNIDPTLELISRGLDACTLRQAVYSANVANVNTPGYRPEEVRFDAELRAAAQAVRGEPLDEQTAVLESVRPSVVPSAAPSVEVDQQLALMSENAVRYDTLLNAYEKSMGLLRLAILQGKNG
jgi:flagellar basal-body rod protein FlgB